MAAASEAVRQVAASTAGDAGMVAHSIGITGASFRWPNCEVPYEIDPNLPDKQRVLDAIAHWVAKTSLKFPAKTAAHQNWVHFTDAGGCWSYVGMQGTGAQTISLGSGCSKGNAIHEIGHAIGLWHEQSREDRDLFVTIKWANISSGQSHNFDQHVADGDDLGAYDYGSIMHYPRKAFSKNGQDPIVPVDANVDIGQRNGLSAGDIGGVKALYPKCGLIQPPKFKKIIDDPPKFKKFSDDKGSFKKVSDDLKPKKPIWDSIGGGIGPVKKDQLVTRGLQPFSLLAPHHAALAGAGSSDEAVAVAALEALETQVLDLQAAIATAEAAVAQRTADAAHLRQEADALIAAHQAAVDSLGE